MGSGVASRGTCCAGSDGEVVVVTESVDPLVENVDANAQNLSCRQVSDFYGRVGDNASGMENAESSLDKDAAEGDRVEFDKHPQESTCDSSLANHVMDDIYSAQFPIAEHFTAKNKFLKRQPSYPVIGSPSHATLQQHFPGALPGVSVHAILCDVLDSESFGLTPENTLFGTSICPDEINAETGDLPDLMKCYWGECFPMGGLSGAPFVGKTGFRAFSGHVPDDGHVFVFYGPHVAVCPDGEVGLCLRPGQSKKSTACGAVVGAYHACCQCVQDRLPLQHDEDDIQMCWIKRHIYPHTEHIQSSPYPMVALARFSYDMVDRQIERVVNNDFGSGYLILCGGIMINTPEDCEDHFLPLRFEARRQGEPARNLLSALSS